jgi:hypothetical protein
VERGQHQLALRQVRALVEQDHRVGAHDRLEDLGALAWVQDLRRGGEDLLDLVRVGQVNGRRALQQAHREPLAVASPAALEEGNRACPPGERLDGSR